VEKGTRMNVIPGKLYRKRRFSSRMQPSRLEAKKGWSERWAAGKSLPEGSIFLVLFWEKEGGMHYIQILFEDTVGWVRWNERALEQNPNSCELLEI